MDSTAINVTMIPFGAAPMPTCRVPDGGNGIPVVHWDGEGHFANVDLLLGNVTDPADYLRRLARMLSAFAVEVDAALDTRQPSGASS